jgi:hypothetical protein
MPLKEGIGEESRREGVKQRVTFRITLLLWGDVLEMEENLSVLPTYHNTWLDLAGKASN